MVLDIFALIVIALLIGVVIWLVVLLGSMPGEIARKRNHPQTEAIKVLGWIGIITLGMGWFVAFVWAYYKPNATDPGLEERVKELESTIENLKAEGGES